MCCADRAGASVIELGDRLTQLPGPYDAEHGTAYAGTLLPTRR